jgi:hypothetical protein
MLPTYPAVIRDGRIEWTGEKPAGLRPDQATPCHVTILEPQALPIEGRKALRAAAMERAAARGGIRAIPDPVAWQREEREDRPLPGRDE